MPLLVNRCSIKHPICPFLDFSFNAAYKTGNFGLNSAFNIEVLMNRIKVLRYQVLMMHSIINFPYYIGLSHVCYILPNSYNSESKLALLKYNKCFVSNKKYNFHLQ